jgi:hypothetical protein
VSGLPPGRQVSPVLWVTDEPVDDAGARWASLRRDFGSTGLWPLVLGSLDGDPTRPWLAGEFGSVPATDPSEVDVAATLARWWEDALPDEDEEPEAMEAIAPFDPAFPGLAPASDGPVEKGAVERVALGLGPGRLGLVPVTRPADVFAVLGWEGPMNVFSDMGLLSAVARSWEDRFGAVPVGLGFAEAVFGVPRPPAAVVQATLVAAEHFAVCPDVVYQGDESIGAYARRLLGAPAWSLWWD